MICTRLIYYARLVPPAILGKHWAILENTYLNPNVIYLSQLLGNGRFSNVSIICNTLHGAYLSVSYNKLIFVMPHFMLNHIMLVDAYLFEI